MSRSRTLLTCILAAGLASCGGNPSGPDGPPTPVPGAPVTGFVFYDENANGLADPGESVRLPGVAVSIGPRTGQTAAGGRFTVENVPPGTQSASVQASSLPAYFTPGTPASVSVPQSGELLVPATLPLGQYALPNVYMAFGDSITVGDGRSNYRDRLLAELRNFLGKAEVVDEGEGATRSGGLNPRSGESRIERSLAKRRPSHVLIMYGTNDYNDPDCRSQFPCFTIDALRYIIEQTREAGAHPILATIPPVNPTWADRNAEDRADWVKRMNEQVKALAAQQRVALADVHADMLKQPSLPALFADFLHPNDEGYRLISQSFFNAITKPLGATTSSRRRGFSFGPHAPF